MTDNDRRDARVPLGYTGKGAQWSSQDVTPSDAPAYVTRWSFTVSVHSVLFDRIYGTCINYHIIQTVMNAYNTTACIHTITFVRINIGRDISIYERSEPREKLSVSIWCIRLWSSLCHNISSYLRHIFSSQISRFSFPFFRGSF